MRTVCSKPKVSAYDFMRYLFATLVKQNKFFITYSDIVRTIHDFKTDNEQWNYLFEDIEFRQRIDLVISDDIINTIKYMDSSDFQVVIYGKNLVIYLTDKSADKILNECDENTRVAMNELAKRF